MGLRTSVRRTVARQSERVLNRLGLIEPREVPQPAPVRAEPVAVPEPAVVEPEPQEEPIDDAPFTAAMVEEIFDDMVRPALAADGGDIQLIEVRGSDVVVELLGACHSCPSAIATMKGGIERLLIEELPGFGELIRLGDDDGAPA